VLRVPADQRDDQYLGLAEILRAVGRRWRWVVGSVIVLVALALFLSLQQDSKYRASVRLLLRTVADDTSLIADPNAQVPFFADRQLQNEIQVIESFEVQRAVEAAYEGDLRVGEVTAEVVQVGADAVELSVTSTDPDAAADLVNLYAEKYVELSQSQEFDSLEAANTQLQDRLATVNERRATVAAPLETLENQLEGDPTNEGLRTQLLALQVSLGSEIEALDNLRTFYIQAQENLALTRGLSTFATAKVLSPATPPDSPVSPKPIRDGIIGLMGGLGVGLALALAREFLDQSIRTTDDLERTVKGRYPVLGVVPEATAAELTLTGGRGDHSAAAEAYRALRTSVRFAELDRPMKVIQVTSGSPGEGKTTTAANLARALTQAGHRVAVACCDLRRPTIHELFGANVSPGLADVVLGDRTLAEAITQIDALTYVLPAGSSPPNPSELLGSGRADRVIAALADEMDYVVIDTTPVLPVTDSIVVSRFADATIVVVNAGKTTRTQLHHALSSLEQASAPIIGLVLNRALEGDRNSYGYSYGYDYGKRGADSANGGVSERAVGVTAGRRVD